MNQTENQNSPTTEVFLGFAFGAVVQVVGSVALLLIAGALNPYMWVLIMAIGFLQGIYVAPAFLWIRKIKKSNDFQKGFLIPCCILFLLNAACWGVVLLG